MKSTLSLCLVLFLFGCGGNKTTNPKDSTAPTVTLSADRDTVDTSGSVLLTATASDNLGVETVEFYEGATLLATLTQAPYTHTVDYTVGDNGEHSYHAVALDAAGNTGTSGVKTVTVAIPSLPLFDDFNDGETDPTQWQLVDDWNNDQGVTIEEKNGRLEAFIPASATGSVFGRTLTTVCKIVGDFDVQVDYQVLDWPANNGVRAAIGVHLTTERVSFAAGEFNGKESYAADHVGSISVVETTDTAGTLRLTRVGDVWSSWYKEGGNWVLLKESTQSFTDAVSIKLGVWSDNTTFGHQDVRIAFDNFQVNTATPEGCG